jgi:hypothetical protein
MGSVNSYGSVLKPRNSRSAPSNHSLSYNIILTAIQPSPPPGLMKSGLSENSSRALSPSPISGLHHHNDRTTNLSSHLPYSSPALKVDCAKSTCAASSCVLSPSLASHTFTVLESIKDHTIASDRTTIPTLDGQINNALQKEDGVYGNDSSSQYATRTDTYSNLLDNGSIYPHGTILVIGSMPNPTEL